MKSKKVYVILVALEPDKFEYYYMKPQIYYDSFKEAKTQMQKLIDNKTFHSSQLKIQPLWTIQKEPHS